MTSVVSWTASKEAIDLFKILKPLGDIEQYRFEDWRNKAVSLVGDNCASTVYCRPGESYILLANFDPEPKKVTCTVKPRNLPYPLSSVGAGAILEKDVSKNINIKKLTGSGETITLPDDNAVLIHIK